MCTDFYFLLLKKKALYNIYKILLLILIITVFISNKCYTSEILARVK